MAPFVKWNACVNLPARPASTIALAVDADHTSCRHTTSVSSGIKLLDCCASALHIVLMVAAFPYLSALVLTLNEATRKRGSAPSASSASASACDTASEDEEAGAGGRDFAETDITVLKLEGEGEDGR